MATTARSTSTNGTYQFETQTAHGFLPGNVIIFSGSTFALARAASLAACAGVMMVSITPTANTFYATQVGFLTGLESQSFTPGSLYYVSASSAGSLTTNAPSSVGNVILPCFVSTTSTSGFFFTGQGELIQSSELFAWNTVTSNTAVAINNGYMCNSGSSLAMTLPTTFSVGDQILIYGISTGGWNIVQPAVSGYGIQIGNVITMTGAGGSLTANAGSDCIQLVGAVANTTWKCIVQSGNISYV